MRIEHPSLTDDDTQLATDLHDWLSSNRQLEGLVDDYMFRGNAAPWYSELVSNLTLLCGGDTIDAAFVNVDLESYLVSVHVVTTRRIVEAQVTGRRESQDLRCRAISRSGVRDVRTDESYGLIDREQRRDWPGAFTVTVTVDGFDKPLSFRPSPQTSMGARQPDMKALTRSLLANLDE